MSTLDISTQWLMTSFLVKKRKDLEINIDMATEGVATAEVELEDTAMIEDDHEREIDAQKCSDQYEKYKDLLEIEKQKLEFHDECIKYLTSLCKVESEKVKYKLKNCYSL